MRTRGSGIAGNPVLIGAATVLVVIVAVFLSYNANQGLPFVPTYALKAQTPSAANLVRGNEVRIGGTRVGSVDKIEVERRKDGTSIAVLGLKLERSVSPLPKDSTVLIRPRSALGLKYVELTRGTSEEGFDDGDTIPLASATPAPVEFDEFVNMFDDETRGGLADEPARLRRRVRGPRPEHQPGDRRAAAAAARHHPGRAEPLQPADEPAALRRRARRRGGHRGAGRRDAGAAVRRPRPHVRRAARGRAALHPGVDLRGAGDARRGDPRVPASSGRSSPTPRACSASCAPACARCAAPRPTLADALEVGTPTLLRLPALNRRLASLLTELERFSQDPLVPRGIRRLTDTVRTLNPTLQFLAPTQTTCNYMALWFRNISSLLSEGDVNGTWQRFIIVATPLGPNNEGGPSSAPADGPTVENHLHTNPYPNTAAPGQTARVRGGQRGLRQGPDDHGNAPGTQQAATEGKP